MRGPTGISMRNSEAASLVAAFAFQRMDWRTHARAAP